MQDVLAPARVHQANATVRGQEELGLHPIPLALRLPAAAPLALIARLAQPQPAAPALADRQLDRRRPARVR